MAAKQPIADLEASFGMEDPRIERQKLQKILDIIIIGIWQILGTRNIVGCCQGSHSG